MKELNPGDKLAYIGCNWHGERFDTEVITDTVTSLSKDGSRISTIELGERSISSFGSVHISEEFAYIYVPSEFTELGKRLLFSAIYEHLQKKINLYSNFCQSLTDWIEVINPLEDEEEDKPFYIDCIEQIKDSTEIDWIQNGLFAKVLVYIAEEDITFVFVGLSGQTEKHCLALDTELDPDF